MYALIFENQTGVRVIQIEENPFPVYGAMTWIPIPEGVDVKIGDFYMSEQFVPAPEPEAYIIPDSIFQKAVKKMIKNIMQYINGSITKTELNNRYDAIKDAIEQINEVK